MHNTSTLYNELLRSPHYEELKLLVNGVEYGEDSMYTLDLSGAVIPGNTLQVGACPARKIATTIVDIGQDIPEMSKLEPFARLSDGSRFSEWIAKGVYYIDTRDPNAPPGQLSFVGYDDMLKAEAPYPGSSLTWPAADIDVVREIARSMGVSVDARTVAQITRREPVPFPAQYTQREVLGFIAAMYAGCFIMSDSGELLLISLSGLPSASQLLVTESGDAITIGGVRIRV